MHCLRLYILPDNCDIKSMDNKLHIIVINKNNAENSYPDIVKHHSYTNKNRLLFLSEVFFEFITVVCNDVRRYLS
jgi:hypothetical protein